MAYSEDYLDFIIDQLEEFGPIEPKKMFGGIGFFKEGLMFAMIGYGCFRLKVDDSNKQEYEEAGMLPLVSGTKKKSMPYWEVPVEVIEDKHELIKWAKKSYAAAQRAKKK
jgi:DNA transformation protein